MVDILSFLDSKEEELKEQALKIWDYAELPFYEHKSVKVLADYLKEQGFRVEMGVGGLPTAFIAEWGEGKPIIGFLGEYDALAGLSQEVVAERKPKVAGEPGHGCGHNLLGVACLGAALAVKEYLEKNKKAGTVRYYGCPAEEVLAGKVYMAREGLFSDLDTAIAWHPASVNTVSLASSTALNSALFTFKGITAHAAADPHNGRSALDAVEIMNVGANYLREHVITSARIHYVIINGGKQPNVVPADAEVWYYVRAPHRYQVEEIFDRLVDIAKGAALVTGTTFKQTFLTGCYEILGNKALAELQYKNLEKVGAPKFDEKDFEFAAELAKTFEPSSVKASLSGPGYKEHAEQFEKGPLHVDILPIAGEGTSFGASSDVGDVSWITPTASLSVATQPLGCPGHSWQLTASVGSGIGLKAMMVAAKVQALTAIDLFESPEILEKVKKEHYELTKDNPYKCPFPADQPFPLKKMDELFSEG